MEPRDSADARDLVAFGYKPELRRRLGSFSSFAAGFSYLSILTGLFQTFYLGFRAGGPAFFWTWPMVFLGQLMVALCFAELAAHYPLAGSVYQWSKYVGSRALGWLTGWVYLASYVISLAAVAIALQITLPQIDPRFQLVGDPGDPRDCARNAVLLGCLLIGFTTVINAVGVGLMAKINDVGVLTELCGALLLIVLLLLHAQRGPDVVLETQGRGQGEALGYLGPFLGAALVASFVMYGYDTAGTLAEETREPRRKVPRAILQALTAAAALGALLILFGLMAAPNLHDGKLGDERHGLPYLVRATLPEPLGTVFLVDVIFAITVCALAVHAGGVRLIFAMARDNNLPMSATLARVYGGSGTPIVAAVLVGVVAASMLVANIAFPELINAVLYIAIVWANLAYLLVTAPLLVRRLRSWPTRTARAKFLLGRWGLPVNVLAVLWGVFMVVNMSWPRSAVYGDTWYEQFAPPLFTAILVSAGLVYYGLVQRYKARIRQEQQAVPHEHT
jgi:urea carboxylase system permease